MNCTRARALFEAGDASWLWRKSANGFVEYFGGIQTRQLHRTLIATVALRLVALRLTCGKAQKAQSSPRIEFCKLPTELFRFGFAFTEFVKGWRTQSAQPNGDLRLSSSLSWRSLRITRHFATCYTDTPSTFRSCFHILDVSEASFLSPSLRHKRIHVASHLHNLLWFKDLQRSMASQHSQHSQLN